MFADGKMERFGLFSAYHGIPLVETGMQHLVSQRGSQLEAFDCSLWYVFSTPWLEYLLCDVV